MTEFGLAEFSPEHGRLVITTPSFDFDSFPELGKRLLRMLDATVVEQQLDADLHSWVIDFEGCRLILRAEHYSNAVWLESLAVSESSEELAYLAQLFKRGF